MWAIDAACTLDAVVAALAVNSKKVESLNFYAVESTALADAKFNFKKTPGDTVDRTLNADCHYDILELSEREVLRLSALFRAAGSQRICVFPAVAEGIVASVAAGRIKRKLVPDSLQKEIAELGLTLPP